MKPRSWMSLVVLAAVAAGCGKDESNETTSAKRPQPAPKPVTPQVQPSDAPPSLPPPSLPPPSLPPTGLPPTGLPPTGPAPKPVQDQTNKPSGGPTLPPTGPTTQPPGPGDAAPSKGPILAPPTNAEKAEFTNKGKGYGGGIITEPIRQKFLIEGQLESFKYKKTMDIYKATHGHYPETNEEFQREIIKKGAIKLPPLPAGWRYTFDPKTGELMKEKVAG